MSSIAKTWGMGLILLALLVGGCACKSQLVGSDGSSMGSAPTAGAGSDNSSGGGPVNSGGAGNQATYDVLGPLNLSAGACLPQAIQEASCQILTTRTGAACDCSEAGLVPSSSILSAAVQKVIQEQEQCGREDEAPCPAVCVCEFPRATGTSLIECKTQLVPSSDSTGWCYVSGAAGEPQTELVSGCADSQEQKLRVLGNAGLLGNPDAPLVIGRDIASFLACTDGASPPPPRELGEVCSHDLESANEVDVADQFPGCGSGICLANHFQGLASCPYGQAAGAGDCFLPGHTEPIAGAVKPQLVDRQAAIASICSCQCDGTGPGPYCTCPESMQCEHLVDDLHLGNSYLAGSYCIPKGSAYSSDQQTECAEPNCGVKHPY